MRWMPSVSPVLPSHPMSITAGRSGRLMTDFSALGVMLTRLKALVTKRSDLPASTAKKKGRSERER